MISILQAELRLMLKEWPSFLISLIGWNVMVWGLPYLKILGDLPFLCACYYAMCVILMAMHGCARTIDQIKLHEIRMERGLPYLACLAPIILEVAVYQLSLAPVAVVCSIFTKASLAYWLLLWTCGAAVLVAILAMSEALLLHLLARQLHAVINAVIGGAATTLLLLLGAVVALTGFYLPLALSSEYVKQYQVATLGSVSVALAVVFLFLLYDASKRLPRRRA